MAQSTDDLSSRSDEERLRRSGSALSEEERLRLGERVPQDGLIERVEERAIIDKHRRDTGGVRISTRTEIGSETVRDTLVDVDVEVERVPMDQFVEVAEAPRVEGDVTIVPVYEERLVVEKRLFLIEEVRLRRVTRSREIEESVELRRQVADVERLPPLDGSLDSPDTLKE